MKNSHFLCQVHNTFWSHYGHGNLPSFVPHISHFQKGNETLFGGASMLCSWAKILWPHWIERPVCGFDICSWTTGFLWLHQHLVVQPVKVLYKYRAHHPGLSIVFAYSVFCRLDAYLGKVFGPLAFPTNHSFSFFPMLLQVGRTVNHSLSTLVPPKHHLAPQSSLRVWPRKMQSCHICKYL